MVSVLIGSEGHRSADEIAEEVHRSRPDVHLSTVYRTLEDLERLGVVEHVHLGHGPATYHLSTKRHAHLVCNGCGTTLEVEDSMFDRLAERILKGYGFRLDHRHFAMSGLCATCRESASRRSPGGTGAAAR